MGSTNFTPNLHLPQFIATDKPSWLGDWNDAMKAIDDSAGEQHVVNNKITASFAAINLRIDGEETRITALEQKSDTTDTDITKIQTDVIVLQQNYETIHHEVVTNSNTIAEHSEKIADHETRITSLEGDVANVGKLEEDVEALTQSVGQVNTTVEQLEITTGNHTTQIGALQQSYGSLNTTVEELDQKSTKLTASIAEAQLEIVNAQDDIANLDNLVETASEDINRLGSAITLSAINIYIDNVNGNDNNDGTVTNPIKTFTALLNPNWAGYHNIYQDAHLILLSDYEVTQSIPLRLNGSYIRINGNGHTINFSSINGKLGFMNCTARLVNLKLVGNYDNTNLGSGLSFENSKVFVGGDIEATLGCMNIQASTLIAESNYSISPSFIYMNYSIFISNESLPTTAGSPLRNAITGGVGNILSGSSTWFKNMTDTYTKQRNFYVPAGA